MILRHGSIVGLSLVTIGVGLEGAGIDDSFVIHQAIPFVLGLSEQGVVFRVPDNVVTFGDLDFAWFGKGFLDFILDILTHDVVIQLGVSFTVESEASDLFFFFFFFFFFLIDFIANKKKYTIKYSGVKVLVVV